MSCPTTSTRAGFMESQGCGVQVATPPLLLTKLIEEVSVPAFCKSSQSQQGWSSRMSIGFAVVNSCNFSHIVFGVAKKRLLLLINLDCYLAVSM